MNRYGPLRDYQRCLNLEMRETNSFALRQDVVEVAGHFEDSLDNRDIGMRERDRLVLKVMGVALIVAEAQIGRVAAFDSPADGSTEQKSGQNKTAMGGHGMMMNKQGKLTCCENTAQMSSRQCTASLANTICTRIFASVYKGSTDLFRLTFEYA